MFHRTGISKVDCVPEGTCCETLQIKEGPSSGPPGIDNDEDRLLGTHVDSCRDLLRSHWLCPSLGTIGYAAFEQERHCEPHNWGLFFS